jgi:hypothetical protein
MRNVQQSVYKYTTRSTNGGVCACACVCVCAGGGGGTLQKVIAGNSGDGGDDGGAGGVGGRLCLQWEEYREVQIDAVFSLNSGKSQ